MIFKRGGVYWYKFHWHIDGPDGREFYPIRRSARTANSREAEILENDHKRALRLGEIHPLDPFPKMPAPTVSPMTLREYADVVVRHVSLRGRKARTVGFYQECLKRIERFPRLAFAPLDQVTAELIEAYIDWRRTARDGNTAAAVNGELRSLRRILRFAEEKRLITRAPAIHLLPYQGRDRVLSPQDEIGYLGKASGDLADAAIIAIETGLRPDSELFVLRWENVTAAGLRIVRGKTDAAVRTVPLSPKAKAVLDARRKSAKAGNPFVFPSRSKTGHLITLNKRHAQACREAKLEPFPVYTFRHTYGTRCAESGVDRYTLARWMGHSSPSVTAKYYVHVTERHELAGFERFVEYTEKLRAEAVPLASPKTQ
jgi:integrase